jgi:Fe-S cluster biogenesis protein NfuA
MAVMEETLHIKRAPNPTAVVDTKVLEATLEYIRPALQADGGDLLLKGVVDGIVQIELVGACGGCPLSTMTLTSGIERILVDRVPGVLGVDAGLEDDLF